MADGGNFYSKIRKLNAGDGVGARGVDAHRAIMLVPLHAGGSDAVKAEFTTYNPIEQRDVGGRTLFVALVLPQVRVFKSCRFRFVD